MFDWVHTLWLRYAFTAIASQNPHPRLGQKRRSAALGVPPVLDTDTYTKDEMGVRCLSVCLSTPSLCVPAILLLLPCRLHDITTCCSKVEVGADVDATKADSDQKSYRLVKLPNGLRVLLIHDPPAAVSNGCVFVDANGVLLRR